MNFRIRVKAAAVVCAALFGLLTANAEGRRFWRLQKPGNGIVWHVRNAQTDASGRPAVHSDHVEMAGKKVAVVFRYGIDEKGAFTLNKSMVWPMLRTVPNNTHASLMRRFGWNPVEDLKINGSTWPEKADSIVLDGTLRVYSTIPLRKEGKVSLERTYFPSTDKPALIEIYTLTNIGKGDASLEIPVANSVLKTDPAKGVAGSYTIAMKSDSPGAVVLKPGECTTFTASIAGYAPGEAPLTFDGQKELAARRGLVDSWMENLVLETPDPVLNRMFAFSKIRGLESIYDTHGGPMHGPGGESYYAALWTNDQAEYINPLFPFTGYGYGNESALNCYKLYAGFMNDEWRCIPSSIIAEGDDIWNGAGDRGDCAMLAYGAGRYSLASGDISVARQLWPLIEWCLEYCRRNLNEAGVVKSDSDELEGRLPAGDANLCTSSLYYDALLSASYLARELGKGKKVADGYRRRAGQLRKDIDKYFGAEVEGFDAYRYYDGNDKLRAWICIPLVMGIDDRAEGTIEALFSPNLWTENGLLSVSGDKTFWDRSTLYALRGVYAVGAPDKATEFLKKYSGTRLLGEHVPYAVEAWPEGSQRHLSAESGLYARIFTEGMFGMRPTGLHSLTIAPQMPSDWNSMSLRHVRAFGSDFDVEVTRLSPSKLLLKVIAGGKTIVSRKVAPGTPVSVTLPA